MDIQGTPVCYGGRVDAPLLTTDEDALCLAIRDSSRIVPSLGSSHAAAASLRLIAERLECDAQVDRIGSRLSVRAGYGDYRDGHGNDVVAVCVTVYADAEPARSINAAAAARLANRLDSGMDPTSALARTVEQCQTYPLSETEIRQLEHNANAWVRRLTHIDQMHSHDLGSPAHREDIARANAEMP